jgi:protein arginine N-methyltransferase 3
VREVVSSEGDGVMLPCGDDVISTLKLEDDQLYIDSYSHFSIHEEMLKDTIRTNSYRDCMYQNESVFRDRIVLDIGCGLGILSMFAARAGARLVIGVDQSEIVFQAMDIIRENGFEDKITLLHGKMEEVTLPVEKVDIIISEWMGYFLLYESMLDTVLWARNQYLKSDGLVLPDYCSLSLVGIHDDDMLSKRVAFWDDVSGFKMSCMKSVVIAEPEIRVIDKKNIITEPSTIKVLNTLTCLYKDLEFTSEFSLVITQPGRITSLVGYFDVEFRCPSKVEFSTGPMKDSTHWKQTVFLLPKPLDVSLGEVIKGQLACKKNRKDPRCLTINITLDGQTTTYQMQ